MSRPQLRLALLASLTLAVIAPGCGGDDDVDLSDARPAIDAYAAGVSASYTEAVARADLLKTAVDAFVAAPSADTLEAARSAWLAAREPYGLTEAFRFYDGPIDDPDTGPEGLMNGWPMNEAFIDYVAGNPSAGIINDPTRFPTLTREVIAAENEHGGENNIATGYHAIEFLLWGQDLSPTGPGARPFTDYLTSGGSAANQARRGAYLKTVTAALVSDLTSVRDAWSAGASNYRSGFTTGSAQVALRRILTGMGSLSGAELSGERMTVAYDNKTQEQEHSCFSDNTHRDLLANATGIQNVWLGRYAGNDGAGLDDLVRSRDAALADKMTAQLAASIAAIQAIPAPFDQAILGDDSAPGRVKVLAAIRALQAQTETTVEVASLLGIKLNLE